MLRIASFIMLGLLLAAPGTLPGESTRKKEMFCPECWKFLTQPGDLDYQGRCSATGRKPVEVDAVTVNWFWCRRHEAWHRRPCGKDSAIPSGSTALLVRAGSEPVTEHAYCPEDRMISDIGFPGLNCPACGKPLAGADTVERRWYWCRTGQAWLTKPCSASAARRCCTARSGTVLAYPWQIPFLGTISHRSPERGEMRVESEWLAAHLEDPHLVVLHVGFDPSDEALSGRSTYFDGHIPGARPIAWSEIAVTRNGLPNEFPPAEQLVQMVRSLGIDTHDRLVLYDTGFGVEAARAYLALDYLGLGGSAALLDGQWARWKSLKLPDSRMPEEVEPSAFVPRLHPEIFVSLPSMKDLAWLAREEFTSVALLDARAADEYSGYRTGKDILRGGHVPGAANLCWSRLFERTEEPILRSEGELRSIFEASGARPGRTIVTYCRTGTEASLLYFAARVLGYEAKFYDGSYYEWSRNEETPIEGGWVRR